jgi:hypothetical protein
MRRRRPPPLERPAWVRHFDPADWDDTHTDHDAEIIARDAQHWGSLGDSEIAWWAGSVRRRAEHRWSAAADHWAEMNHIDPAAWLYWQLSRPR